MHLETVFDLCCISTARAFECPIFKIFLGVRTPFEMGGMLKAYSMLCIIVVCARQLISACYRHKILLRGHFYFIEIHFPGGQQTVLGKLGS